MINPQYNETDLPFQDKLPKRSGTYFRVAYYTQLNLSRQADHKAHLMLGLNTLVLSLVVSKRHTGMLGKVDNLWWPNLLLVVVCLTVAVLAVIASRPALPRRKAKLTPNWLFFGSFAEFSFAEFKENLDYLGEHEAALQEALSRDLYLMGKVLAKKYRYLSYCYWVFGVGLLAVAVTYAYFIFLS